MYVRRDLESLGGKACLLKAFMEYIISPEGQALLPAYGAVGIPSQVVTIAQTAIDLLKMPACKEWSFEGSSTVKGGGQADYIISRKRRAFYEYGGSTQDGLIAALQTEVEALKAQSSGASGSSSPSPSNPNEVAVLKAQQQQLENELDALKRTPPTSTDDDSLDTVGVASLIVAVVSILINMCLSVYIFRASRTASSSSAGGQILGKGFGSQV